MAGSVVLENVLCFNEHIHTGNVAIDGHARVADGMRRVQSAEGSQERGYDGLPPFDNRILESCLCGSRAKVRNRVLRQRGRKKLLVAKIDAGGETIQGLDNSELVGGLLGK